MYIWAVRLKPEFFLLFYGFFGRYASSRTFLQGSFFDPRLSRVPASSS